MDSRNVDILFAARQHRVCGFFQALGASTRLRTRLISSSGWSIPDWRALVDFPWLAVRPLVRYHAEVRRRQGGWLHLASVPALYRLTLWVRAIVSYPYMLRAIDAARPAAVGVWNGSRFPDAMLAVAARVRNVRTFFFELGSLPNTLFIDPLGVNAASSVPRHSGFFRALPAAEHRPAALLVRPRRRTVVEHPAALPPRYVFAPFQVDADSQIVCHSPWIAGMRDFYAVLVELQRRLTATGSDLRIVIKEHPSERRRWRGLGVRARRDGLLLANGNPTPELIAGAGAIVTINSSVGLEALSLGRKVVVLGDAVYGIPGLVRIADDAATLFDAVNRLDDWWPDEALRARFLHWLESECLVRRFVEPPAAIDGLATQGGEDWAAIEARLRRLLGADRHAAAA